MIVLSSINGKMGMRAAVEALRAGASALDAVEAGARIVERNPEDRSVGLGGLPNLLGEVRLDAAIMDGRSLRAGAVGSVRGFVHVITLARRVMERTPHVLLVGDGAERFAVEMGMAPDDPLTPESEAAWRERLLQHDPQLDPSQLARGNLCERVWQMNQPMAGWNSGRPHGTVNFIAQDARGDLATAVSTSGWPWAYPGRLGDSPVIGAGGYADNRWGAAASTGTGEVVLRTSLARSVILYMKTGLGLCEATMEALRDLRDLNDPYSDHIAVIALDRSGRHVGYTHRPGERYTFMAGEMDEPEEVEMVRPA